jgi:hypothetical protein
VSARPDAGCETAGGTAGDSAAPGSPRRGTENEIADKPRPSVLESNNAVVRDFRGQVSSIRIESQDQA